MQYWPWSRDSVQQVTSRPAQKRERGYTKLIVKDPKAARPYLLSEGQNMYNRVVLVCTMNVHIPASLDRRPILRYQVLQVRKQLYSLYLQSED